VNGKHKKRKATDESTPGESTVDGERKKKKKRKSEVEQ